MPSEAMAAPTAVARPHRLHAFTLLFQAITIARAFLLPAIAAVLGSADDDVGRMITIGIGVLTVPALVLAIAKYATFRYRLNAAELVIDSGILVHRRRIIPVARIQNIDVQQTWLQRICGVAELRVETAGAERTEAVLSVLGRDVADALRAELLARRADAGAAPPEHAGPPVELLARLSVRDLAVAGATANEAGLVAAILAGGLQLLEDLTRRIPLPDLDPTRLAPATSGVGVALVAAAGLAALALAILVIGWVLSIAGAMIGYYGFTLERVGDELHKRYGLLGRRESSVPLRRVQAVRIEESLLRRPFGLAALKIETAGSAAGGRPRGGAEAFLPIVRVANVPALVESVLDGLDPAGVRIRPVDRLARRRLAIRYTAPVLFLTAALTPFFGTGWLLLLGLVPPGLFLADRGYRHRGWAVGDGFVIARNGFLNRITWIVPEHKIQTLHLRQTPFQRRHGLATLTVDTASGGRGEARVIDLAREDAEALLESLARRVAP